MAMRRKPATTAERGKDEGMGETSPWVGVGSGSERLAFG